MAIWKIVNTLATECEILCHSPSGWVENEGTMLTDHNSPYEYDSHVSLIWYGWTVNRATVTRNVNMTDIAVTLSELCKVPYPNASTGHPLTELLR